VPSVHVAGCRSGMIAFRTPCSAELLQQLLVVDMVSSFELIDHG
jgi:hypothetical protein